MFPEIKLPLTWASPTTSRAWLGPRRSDTNPVVGVVNEQGIRVDVQVGTSREGDRPVPIRGGVPGDEAAADVGIPHHIQGVAWARRSDTNPVVGVVNEQGIRVDVQVGTSREGDRPVPIRGGVSGDEAAADVGIPHHIQSVGRANRPDTDAAPNYNQSIGTSDFDRT